MRPSSKSQHIASHGSAHASHISGAGQKDSGAAGPCHADDHSWRFTPRTATCVPPPPTRPAAGRVQVTGHMRQVRQGAGAWIHRRRTAGPQRRAGPLCKWRHARQASAHLAALEPQGNLAHRTFHAAWQDEGGNRAPASGWGGAQGGSKGGGGAQAGERRMHQNRRCLGTAASQLPIRSYLSLPWMMLRPISMP